MFKKLIDFFFQKVRFKRVIIIEPGEVNEIPNKTILLTKKGNSFTWARFKCPCGCEETIRLSLSPIIEPFWHLKLKEASPERLTVSISPSVYMRNTKCGSHYFIIDNKVTWCKKIKGKV